MIVWTFAIRDTERASTIVTIAGSPSGTAATAKDMAVISISPTGRSCQTATANSAPQRTSASTLSTPPKSPNLF